MLIVFKSPASHDVVMFEQNARELLQILGKRPEAPMGVVTPEQLADAISRLRTAVGAEATQPKPDAAADSADADADAEPPVSLGHRALPFIELLERSLAEKVPVTWGV